jgi:hypothetical protein
VCVRAIDGAIDLLVEPTFGERNEETYRAWPNGTGYTVRRSASDRVRMLRASDTQARLGSDLERI